MKVAVLGPSCRCTSYFRGSEFFAISCQTLNAYGKTGNPAKTPARRRPSRTTRGISGGRCDPAPEAWDYLKGLRGDDFPAEIRPAFSFLEHEISRAESQELSAREIAFLTDKIQRLESMWISANP